MSSLLIEPHWVRLVGLPSTSILPSDHLASCPIYPIVHSKPFWSSYTQICLHLIIHCIMEVARFLPPKLIKELLWKLILWSDYTSKHTKIPLMTHAWPIRHFPNIRVSYACCKLVKVVCGLPSRPWIRPVFFDLSDILLKLSASKTNISTKRGPPCCKFPLQTSSFMAVQFTRTFFFFCWSQPRLDPSSPSVPKTPCPKDLQ